MIARVTLLALLAGCAFDQGGLAFHDATAPADGAGVTDASALDGAGADAPVSLPDATPDAPVDACVDIYCDDHDDCPEGSCCFQAVCAVGVVSGGCNPEVWWEPCS